eukprot:TRINITY_DN18380_c0_g1_i1.p1 TRINITY_DN18380_c0_g1~~TRINITY_DN18380_c0_g1_i1.p1  ORF type:complete len:121 (+),score=10.28 TRINITY_DN18380_c0_g1_i1:167-529(+)
MGSMAMPSQAMNISSGHRRMALRSQVCWSLLFARERRLPRLGAEFFLLWLVQRPQPSQHLHAKGRCRTNCQCISCSAGHVSDALRSGVESSAVLFPSASISCAHVQMMALTLPHRDAAAK